MKRIVICFCVIFIMSFSTANAESILLSGNVTKKSNHTYLLQSEKTSYHLIIDKNNKATIKEINAAAKSNNQIFLMVEPQEIKNGPNKGKLLMSNDGLQIMKVEYTVNPNNIGTETVTFLSLSCGDSCYFTFINREGKEESYYATNFYGSSKLENDSSYKGRRIKITWMKTGQPNDEIKRGVIAAEIDRHAW